MTLEKRSPGHSAALPPAVPAARSAAGRAHSQEAKKPNILVIWGDDIGWYNISAYNLG